MSETTSIAEAVAILTSNPRPILCFDTCDLLDVVRSFEEKGNAQSEMVRRLLDVLSAEPNRIQPIITYLVRHEWSQNVEESGRRALSHLQETDERISRIVASCDHVEINVVRPPTEFANLPLVQGLIGLTERLMGRTLVLEKEDLCIERALGRLMDRRRPSHKGAVKDSIHLEHCLEFSRQLGQAKFEEQRLFISANKADFWDGPPRLHRDLEGEFDAAGLQFFGKLEAALGRLGI